MKKSLHILADFHDCRGELKYFTRKSAMRSKTLAVICRAGFRIVASRFHKFPPNGNAEGGITGVVIVSESHITIHTWPERKFVNLDVFFCNYTRDNTRKARLVFQEFKRIYQPKRARQREVWRD
jgi:S-adenosylmethionine decarboxylase proenzyme